MKKFQKLFMAVAAVAGVTACTTDATEDLGVNLNGGQTTLTLSLDDTRTQLGEKADGIYPLTWAENDAISVNGSVSNALAEDEAGAASATFTFNGGFGSAPYFVAYPAVENTTNQVVFAAEQTHTSNTTFGNGAAVMYGYATDLSNVTLSHLTGVLKIGIVSGTEELTYIKEVRISTVDRKPIAGTFSVDEKGKLTPVKTADVITYKSESDAGFPVPVGTATSENPAYIHVAVPAGVYGELYVTLESADGVMYKVVKTDSTKPLNAGKVREFSDNIEFVPTDEAEVFVISNYGDLYEYKEAVEKGSTLGAVLVKDIEIPATNDVQLPAWEPINAPAYAATFNGNGYAINGLAKPLFDSVAATIKGVHLKDVKIAKEYTSANTGALVNTYAGASITHCSASGTITLARDTSVANTIGGLVGSVSNFTTNWEISDCVNNCAITVTLTKAETSTTTFVGGIIADSYKATNATDLAGITVSLENNTNNGAISVTGANGNIVGASGIAARLYSCKLELTNCVNTNSVYVELSSSTNVYATGILGKYNAPESYNLTATDCSNSGFISTTLTGANTSNAYSAVAGCFGDIENINTALLTITNCDNSGNVELNAPTSVANQFHVAGIGGCFYGRVKMENCNNTSEYVKTNINTTTDRLCTGGLVGRFACRAKGNESKTADNILWAKNCDNSADILSTVNTSQKVEHHIGGAFGILYAYNTMEVTTTLDNVDNYGSVIASLKNYSNTDARTWVGGIIGTNYISGSNDNAETSYQTLKGCDNGKEGTDKVLKVTGAQHYYVYAGGMISYCFFPTTMENCSNHMNFVLDADAVEQHIYYGGAIGKLTYDTSTQTTLIKNFVNTGDITVSKTSCKKTDLVNMGFAGVLGYVNKSSKDIKVKLEDIVNKGDITIGDATNTIKCNELYVAGLHARMDSRANSTYTFAGKNVNVGNISVQNVNATTTYVGGAIGLLYKDISNIQSFCNITIDDATITATNKAFGALVGGNISATTAYSVKDCKVGGKYNGETLKTDNYMSLICGYDYATYSNVTVMDNVSEVEYPAQSNE